MPQFIDDSTFGDYFTDFEHTAWRLETRRGYASDRAVEKYARFVAGEPLPDDSNRPWGTNIRVQTGLGKRVERVRVVDRPPTQGQLFLLAAAASNNAAGEDIRNMWRPRAEALALPTEDFWLFDSRRALLLHFDDEDEYLGSELIEDPAHIVRYCRFRDAAWHHATRREGFLAEVASLV
ncbi:DUF6879 family protein [Streptomyces paludis]|uniref:DUF6879 domain-containing protein n=1 Tax=Streptomyces paludis TaxID=2282738 RepID=A0A345HUI8_9ACTN|nr:DUF6879 family protein [Streptomyces paludis]AXG80362.1 hypothetical protein DVK44_24870 [Streptomyces paludis]